MFANIENPPHAAPVQPQPRLDHARHHDRLRHISALLTLAARARERAAYCRQQCDTYSFLSSPFVSLARWQEDHRRWLYISYRLERYYFRQLCELNSIAYREIAR